MKSYFKYYLFPPSYSILGNRIYAYNSFFETYIKTLGREIDPNHQDRYEKIIKVNNYLTTGRVRMSNPTTLYLATITIDSILPTWEVTIPSVYWSPKVLSDIIGCKIESRGKIIEKAIAVYPTGARFVVEQGENFKYVSRLLNNRLERETSNTWIKPKPKKKTKFLGL